MAGTVNAAPPRDAVRRKAYSRGITEELPEPTRRTRALPPAPFALHGAVITPDGAWSSGYVTVANGLIDRVSTHQPTDVAVLETDGVILPGLLDLHGHPEFNVFAAWEPPKLYDNRYAWRRSKPYQALVRDPQNILLTQVPPKTQTRYAEVRALVGGVTGIQGASGCEQRLVRAARAQPRPVGLRGAPRAIDGRPALGLVRAAELRGRHEADRCRRRQRLLPPPVRGSARRCSERQGVPALPRSRRRDAGDEHHPREPPSPPTTCTRSPGSGAASSGRRSRTSVSTARRRWPARRSRPGCPSRSAPTGCRPARRACSPR